MKRDFIIRNRLRSPKLVFSFIFRLFFRIGQIISYPFRNVFRMFFRVRFLIDVNHFHILKVSFRMFSFYKTTIRGLEFKTRRALNSLRCATLRAQPSSKRRNEPRRP